MKLTCIAAIASVSLAMPAYASDHAWQVRSQTDDGKVISIIAESETDTGLMLSCKNDRLVAGVSLVTGLVSDRLDTFTKRAKRKKATTQIGDRDARRDVWTYLPATKVAVSRQGSTGRRFFNAAVRGDTVSWKMDGKDATTFTFPAQNEAFKSFAKSCSVTNGS